MEFDFFSIIIYLLFIVLLAFIVKAFVDIQIIKKDGCRSYLLLQKQLEIAKNKSKVNIEKLDLIDNLNDSYFKRLFEIIKEILLLQKLIFDKQS